MNWTYTIAQALEAIERDLLLPELSSSTLSSQLHLSESHLQRAFVILAGMSIGEYIRRRRLTLAAQELATSRERVIDIALKYHYDTPEAFSKAFRRQHGIGPSEARKPGACLNACTRLRIEIQIKGDVSMNYKLIDKGHFRLVGKSIVTTADLENNQKIIPKFWETSHQNGLIEKICQIEGITALAGSCLLIDRDKKEGRYGICAVVESEVEVNPEFESYTVPPLTWAVFESIGPVPNAIQTAWHQIYAEWFPSTGYEPAEGPELEIYPPGDPSSEDYYCEIWIPVVKK